MCFLGAFLSIFLLGTSSIRAASIAGLPDVTTPSVQVPKTTVPETPNPTVGLTNETLETVYNEAEKVINSTKADSVLMQLEPTVMSRSDDPNPNHKSLMLLVIKKPNLTDTLDIKDRYNAFYINSDLKSDQTDMNMASAVWNVMLDSARDFLTKRIQSLMQVVKQLPASLNGMTGAASAAAAAITGAGVRPEPGPGAASGRSEVSVVSTLPIVFKPQTDVAEPKVILLIPEPLAQTILDPPELAMAEENFRENVEPIVDPIINGNLTNQANLTQSSAKPSEPAEVETVAKPKLQQPGQPIPVPVPSPVEEEMIPVETVQYKTPKFLGFSGFATPAKYMVRPVAGLSGLNVHSADKAYTSIGTMVTNTGLHFSLIGRTSSNSLIPLASWIRRLMLISSMMPK